MGLRAAIVNFNGFWPLLPWPPAMSAICASLPLHRDGRGLGIRAQSHNRRLGFLWEPMRNGEAAGEDKFGECQRAGGSIGSSQSPDCVRPEAPAVGDHDRRFDPNHGPEPSFVIGFKPPGRSARVRSE
jgi:hypothetical protein